MDEAPQDLEQVVLVMDSPLQKDSVQTKEIAACIEQDELQEEQMSLAAEDTELDVNKESLQMKIAAETGPREEAPLE